MPMADESGKILGVQRVEPNKYQINVIKKLYDNRVIESALVEEITYLSDGLKIKAYVARPTEPGEYPAIIWNRGGYKDRGALDDLTAYLILASTAVWGYVVLATQYRGNRGGEGQDDYGGGDVADSLNMLKVAEQYPECDLDRVAVEGVSRGAITTYRMLTMDNRFKCAAVHAGISDLPRLCKQDLELCKLMDKKYSNVSTDEKRSALEKLSVVNFADRLPKSTPILVMHGNYDRTVPIEQSELVVKALEKNDIPHEYHEIEGGTHVALKDGSYKRIDKYRRKWYQDHLIS
jgi:dipeptidyl aminopeptidase/acylaminoacyl peptidase